MTGVKAKSKKRFLGLKAKRALSDTLIYIILLVMVFIWLFPLVWMVLRAFDVSPGTMSSHVFPQSFTLENFKALFPGGASNYEYYPYLRWFLNTLFVAVISCVISTLFVLMVSYALSRLRFKARKKLMNIALILGLFPGFLSMFALYYIFNMLELTNNLVGLAFAYSLASGTGYYIVKGFFDTVPMAIDEAARIDGASRNRIFWQMIIPLSKPIIIYTILTNFIGPWCDYIMVSVFIKDTNSLTVAVGIRSWINSLETQQKYFTRFCAGGVFISIPIVILYMIMQKFYVAGITGGAAKG